MEQASRGQDSWGQTVDASCRAIVEKGKQKEIRHVQEGREMHAGV